MNKAQYLSALETSLQKMKVADTDDILADYEAHFARKALDGYTEEEIAHRLGNPDDIALDFQTDSPKPQGAKSHLWGRLAACLADIGAVVFFPVLFVCVLALLPSAVGVLLLGGYLVGGSTALMGIPYMPLAGKLLMGGALIALAVLIALGGIWLFVLSKQMLRAYGRWHSNRWFGRHELPLPVTPQFVGKARRRLHRGTIFSAVSCLILFAAAYCVMSIQAGAPGFWHVWHWFS
ncbi:MAG: DUF1700 domain-containing protein [Eubacteriales bacterium]|nr:DUF1700 domain-containing protein [Eubacteriales bacterium]